MSSMDQLISTIDAARAYIPAQLMTRSGKVFYSGRNAFATSHGLYVLGENPGGDPDDHPDDPLG